MKTPSPPDMKVRLSAELRAKIEASANASNRTLNGEIISRLEASFVDRVPKALTLLRTGTKEGKPIDVETGVPKELETRFRNIEARLLALETKN